MKLAGWTPTLDGRRPELPGESRRCCERATATQAAGPVPGHGGDDRRVAGGGASLDGHRGRTATSAGDQRTARVRPPPRSGLSMGHVPNPYVGLRAFAEADAPDFRGRDGLACELADAVRSTGMAVVVGASGGGKSSLVHAGLIPRLRASGDRVVTMVPGDDPLAQLRLALLAVARRRAPGQRAPPISCARSPPRTPAR